MHCATQAVCDGPLRLSPGALKIVMLIDALPIIVANAVLLDEAIDALILDALAEGLDD